MTGDEEAVLKEFLLHHREIEDDGDFETWYLQRYEDAESETHYKHTLHVAQVWKRRFEQGFGAGIAYNMRNAKQPAELTEVFM